MAPETGYASPIVIDAGGVRQLIVWHATALTSLNPEIGEIYWEQNDRTSLLEPTFRTRGGASGRWNDRAVLWTHPAFANRHVVVRNDSEIIRASLASADY